MRDQSENWPGLWSTYGPPRGSALCWLIVQSKSSSEFCESWQVSSHWFPSMLKLQEPGSLRMWSRRVGMWRRVTHSVWMYLSQKKSFPLPPVSRNFQLPLTTVELIWSVGAVGLVVTRQVGLDAVTAVAFKVCVCRTARWIHNIYNTKRQTDLREYQIFNISH